jgi:FtsH-binding integral membrane protein
MLAAAAGGYVHVFTNIMQAGLLTVLGSLGLLFALYMTPHQPENQGKRMAYLIGFAFLTGIGLGPVMEVVTMIDSTIVPTAFLATAVIFICFTLSALLSNQRQWIFLGGILFSGLSCLMLLSLSNLFMRSQMLFEVNLYLGFFIMCGFILYDTQLIVEKRRRGDNDYIWHCVDLFIDFVNVFRRLMIILANKENKKKNRRD